MNEEIHVCPPTWPSGPAWDAWCDAFEAWARADERARIEAEDAQKWADLRPLLRSITNGRSWESILAAREDCYRGAAAMWAKERAQTPPWPDVEAEQDNKISFEKRAAA